MRLTMADVRRIRELRADGHTQVEVARIVGCSRSSVEKYAPGLIGKVAVEPLREAFLTSGKTASDVARALGWFSKGERGPDTARVRRTLGLLDDISGTTGHASRRRRMDAETAERIGEVIGVARWELEDAA